MDGVVVVNKKEFTIPELMEEQAMLQKRIAELQSELQKAVLKSANIDIFIAIKEQETEA